MAISNRVSLSLYGPLAERVKRLASSMPHSTINRIGVSCIAAGIEQIERELRDAAKRIAHEDEGV